ncbi:MAG: dCTP deaminase [Candidatus Blackburnbacteria bacterium]|nr:dCTP deaminase [Candidatus Blackburnbacteria bacterium]
MPLGPTKLLELVKTKNLVQNLCERELANPEGAGFDLRIGRLFKISGEAFLGVDERQTPKEEVVAEYQENQKSSYTIQPNDFVLMETMEEVSLPDNLTARNFPRSTLFRSGVNFMATQVAPGYKGKLIFGLKNTGPVPVTIEMGARVAHIQFSEVSGGGSNYRGQWQGGRVAATAREKQV